MQKRFNSLRELAGLSMASHRITTAQFSALVTSLSADKCNNHSAFLKQLKTVLTKVVHRFEALGAMIYYWHYLSYDMLEHVAATFNLKDVLNEFQQFKAEMSVFRKKTKMADFVQTETERRICPPGYTVILIQFNWVENDVNATLEHLEEFRHDYLDHHQLHGYSMILGFVEVKKLPYSYVVTWFTPGVLLDSLPETIPGELKKKYSIIGVACPQIKVIKTIALCGLVK